MAVRIKPKRTATTGNTPTTSDLEAGEIAINLADRIMYYRDTLDNIKTINIADLTDFTTGDLSEGSNLYYTDARVYSAISGGTGVSISGSGVVSIGQAVGTTSDVTFNDVTVDGDLTVNGTTTTLNTTELTIEDNQIELNNGYSGGSPTANAGIIINRGTETDAEIRWNETLDRWELNDGTGYSEIATPGAVDLTTSSINELQDVTVTGTPADNELLAYDTGTSKWINQTAAEASLATTSDIANSANWDTAYGWGDHSVAGYITSADGGDAATLDGIDSASFLRSDTGDTFSGGRLLVDVANFGESMLIQRPLSGGTAAILNNYQPSSFSDGDNSSALNFAIGDLGGTFSIMGGAQMEYDSSQEHVLKLFTIENNATPVGLAKFTKDQVKLFASDTLTIDDDNTDITFTSSNTKIRFANKFEPIIGIYTQAGGSSELSSFGRTDATIDSYVIELRGDQQNTLADSDSSGSIGFRVSDGTTTCYPGNIGTRYRSTGKNEVLMQVFDNGISTFASKNVLKGSYDNISLLDDKFELTYSSNTTKLQPSVSAETLELASNDGTDSIKITEGEITLGTNSNDQMEFTDSGILAEDAGDVKFRNNDSVTIQGDQYVAGGGGSFNACLTMKRTRSGNLGNIRSAGRVVLNETDGSGNLVAATAGVGADLAYLVNDTEVGNIFISADTVASLGDNTLDVDNSETTFGAITKGSGGNYTAIKVRPWENDVFFEGPNTSNPVTLKTDSMTGYQINSNDDTDNISVVNGEISFTLNSQEMMSITDTAIEIVSEIHQNLNATGTTTSSYNIDITKNLHSYTLGADTTFSFTGSLAGGADSNFCTIRLIQGASPYTVTWPGSVKWPGGASPTISTGSGDTDVVTMFTYDGGSNWYAVIAQGFA